MHFTGFEGTEQMLCCHGCIEIILTYLYYSLSPIDIRFSGLSVILVRHVTKIEFWTHFGPISGPKVKIVGSQHRLISLLIHVTCIKLL